MFFSYVLSDEGEDMFFYLLDLFCKVLEQGRQKTIIANGF